MIRTSRTFLLAAGILAASMPSPAVARSDALCDQGLLDLMEGTRAYQLRDGNRCEGEYVQQVNRGLLEVRSFTAAEIDYAVDQPGELFVELG